MKVLIIDDNQMLAESIENQLNKDYEVSVASTAKEGIAQASKENYATILLDLGLPDMPGIEVCRKLREKGIESPVIVLTVTKDVKSRVELLEAGADDFLTKPFNKKELAARISALIRRAKIVKNQAVTIADLQIDLDRRIVTRAGEPITLRRKEFDILAYLVRNQGRPVTRAMILENVWNGKRSSWNNTVDVHIKYLRDKIDKPFNKPLIKTAYGIGYTISEEMT